MAVATEYLDFPSAGSYVTGWGFPRVTLAWECVKCGAKGKEYPAGFKHEYTHVCPTRPGRSAR